MGKPGMLQSVGSQRVGRDLVTEQKQPMQTPSYLTPLPSRSPGPERGTC